MNKLDTVWQAWPESGWLIIAGIIAVAACISTLIVAKGIIRLACIPKGTIDTAEVGYIMLQGQARAMPNNMLNAPLSGSTCVWYRYKVEFHSRGSRNTVIKQGESNDIFFINDGTGLCAIDPLSAKKTATKKLRWFGLTEWPQTTSPGDASATPSQHYGFSLGPIQLHPKDGYTYFEERIHDGDPIYVIGQFGSEQHQPQSSTNAKNGVEDSGSYKSGLNTISPSRDRRRPFILTSNPLQQTRYRRRYLVISLTIFLISSSAVIIQLLHYQNMRF